MPNDENTILVSEYYMKMLNAIEDYVDVEKRATAHFWQTQMDDNLVTCVSGATEEDDI